MANFTNENKEKLVEYEGRIADILRGVPLRTFVGLLESRDDTLTCDEDLANWCGHAAVECIVGEIGLNDFEMIEFCLEELCKSLKDVMETEK